MRILIIVAFLVVSDPPFCSCKEPEPITIEKYNEYDLIVQGQVKEIITEGAQKIIIVEIKEVYKGNINKNNIKILTPAELSHCGLDVSGESEWIIYAYEKDNLYSTNSCTRSSRLALRGSQKKRVEKDLEFLKKQRKAKSLSDES